MPEPDVPLGRELPPPLLGAGVSLLGAGAGDGSSENPNKFNLPSGPSGICG